MVDIQTAAEGLTITQIQALQTIPNSLLVTLLGTASASAADVGVSIASNSEQMQDSFLNSGLPKEVLESHEDLLTSAGGRYDGLVEQVGGPHTPGIGMAFGVERLMLLLDSYNAFDNYINTYILTPVNNNSQDFGKKKFF